MASMSRTRQLVYALVVVLTALTILSFVLPYVGGGHSGLTNLFP
jgi:hypothetical protein